jgi:hypothetical protein
MPDETTAGNAGSAAGKPAEVHCSPPSGLGALSGCGPPPAACYTPPRSSAAVHVCAGLNGCKGLGKNGSGTMPGDGECATAEHICHTHNNCRGQGGCGYEGEGMEQAYPGGQQCRTWGSCATPLNACRISTLGPFRGRSTWEIARLRFEQRMRAAGTPFGPAPREGAPDDYVPSYVVQQDVAPPAACNTKEAVYAEIEQRARMRLKKSLSRAT